jgi:hypothetical protein
MRLTIIPADGFVSVDGKGYSSMDLSFIPQDIHAVQWYGTYGEVEIKDAMGRVVKNNQIDSLEPFSAAVNLWQAQQDAEIEALRKAQQDAEIEAENTAADQSSTQQESGE